jgi:hypothetical protein
MLIAVLATPDNLQLVREGIPPVPHEDGVPLRILSPGEQVVFLAAAEFVL